MIFSLRNKKRRASYRRKAKVGTQVKTKSFDLKEEAALKEIIEDIEREEEKKTAIPTMQLPTEEEPKENIFSASISNNRAKSI